MAGAWLKMSVYGADCQAVAERLRSGTSSLSYDVRRSLNVLKPSAPNRHGQIDVRFSGDDIHLTVNYPDQVMEFIKVAAMRTSVPALKGTGVLGADHRVE